MQAKEIIRLSNTKSESTSVGGEPDNLHISIKGQKNGKTYYWSIYKYMPSSHHTYFGFISTEYTRWEGMNGQAHRSKMYPTDTLFHNAIKRIVRRCDKDTVEILRNF